jgi:hypothetical protein
MTVKVRPILHKRLCREHEMSFVDQAYALQWECTRNGASPVPAAIITMG